MIKRIRKTGILILLTVLAALTLIPLAPAASGADEVVIPKHDDDLCINSTTGEIYAGSLFYRIENRQWRYFCIDQTKHYDTDLKYLEHTVTGSDDSAFWSELSGYGITKAQYYLFCKIVALASAPDTMNTIVEYCAGRTVKGGDGTWQTFTVYDDDILVAMQTLIWDVTNHGRTEPDQYFENSTTNRDNTVPEYSTYFTCHLTEWATGEPMTPAAHIYRWFLQELSTSAWKNSDPFEDGYANSFTILTPNGGSTYQSQIYFYTSFYKPYKVHDKGSITIRKVDANGDPLSGAVFEVYDSNGELVPTNFGYGGDGILVTDASGYATTGIDSLDYGTYTVIETTPPSGYGYPESGRRRTVTVGATNPNVTVTVYNYKYGSIGVRKIDQFGNPVAGARFDIGDSITSDGEVEDGTYYEYIRSETFDSVTTDENGCAVISCDIDGNELMEGDTLYVQETRAPDGYIIDDTIYAVTVSSDAPQSASPLAVRAESDRDKKKVGGKRRIPFEVSADPFYSESNRLTCAEVLPRLTPAKALSMEHEPNIEKSFSELAVANLLGF